VHKCRHVLTSSPHAHTCTQTDACTKIEHYRGKHACAYLHNYAYNSTSIRNMLTHINE